MNWPRICVCHGTARAESRTETRITRIGEESALDLYSDPLKKTELSDDTATTVEATAPTTPESNNSVDKSADTQADKKGERVKPSIRTQAPASPAAVIPDSSPRLGPNLTADLIKRALQSVPKHRFLFIAATLILFAGAGFVIFNWMRPVYRAEAELQIALLSPRLVYTNEEWHKESQAGNYDEYVETLTRKVESTEVLEATIDRLKNRGVEWAHSSIHSTERVNHLRARLDVKRLRDTHFLIIGLDDTEAELTAPIVNATAHCFLENLEKRRADESTALLDALENEEKTLRKSLEETYGELDKLSDRLGSAILDKRQNIFYERIQLLEQGLTKVFLRRVEAEGSLGSAQHRAIQLLDVIPEGDIRKNLELDGRIKDARIMIARRQREIDDSLLGLGSKHPHREIYEKRKQDLQAEMAAMEAKVMEEIRDRLGSQRDEEAERILGDAERNLEALKKSEESMKGELAEAKKRLADYGRAMFEGTRLRSDADRILNELQRIKTRINSVRTEATAPSRVKIHQQGRVPGKPSKDRRVPMLVVALIMSLIGAVLVCWMREDFALRRWRSSMA